MTQQARSIPHVAMSYRHSVKKERPVSFLSADLDSTRFILRLQGPGHLHFLQGLVANKYHRVTTMRDGLN